MLLFLPRPLLQNQYLIILVFFAFLWCLLLENIGMACRQAVLHSQAVADLAIVAIHFKFNQRARTVFSFLHTALAQLNQERILITAI